MTTYHVFKDTIVVHFGDKTISIHRNDPRFELVLKAIQTNDLDSIPNVADNKAQEMIRQMLRLGKRTNVKK